MLWTSERDRVALAAFEAVLQEVADGLAENHGERYDPGYDVEFWEDDGGAFPADRDINRLGSIAYAMSAGLPAIGWSPALRNPGEDERVARAGRQFAMAASMLIDSFTRKQMRPEEFASALSAAYLRQARNAFMAGKRSLGNLSPLTIEDEADIRRTIVAAGMDASRPAPIGSLGAVISRFVAHDASASPRTRAASQRFDAALMAHVSAAMRKAAQRGYDRAAPVARAGAERSVEEARIRWQAFSANKATQTTGVTPEAREAWLVDTRRSRRELDRARRALGTVRTVQADGKARVATVLDSRISTAQGRLRRRLAALRAQMMDGRIGTEQAAAELQRILREEARRAYLAGRRAAGALAMMSADEEGDAEDASDDEEAAFVAAFPEVEGGGIMALLVAMVLDPTNLVDPDTIRYINRKLEGASDDFHALKGVGEKAAFRGGSPAAVDGAPFQQVGDAARQPTPQTTSAPVEAVERAVIVWWVMGNADHCQDCQSLSGRSPFRLAELNAMGLFPGSGHTRCLVEGSRVAGAFTGGYRMRYVGQVVHLETASGRRLTVTPNHPVATPAGFTPAGVLREGDEVLTHATQVERGGRVSGDVAVDEHHRPARVEEVFGALDASSATVRGASPRFPENLHGDALFGQGDIDVVAPLGLLLNDHQPGCPEHIGDGILVPARVAQAEASLGADGTGSQGRFRDGPAPDGVVSSEDLSLPLAGRHPFPLHALRVGLAAENGASLREPAGESAAADAEFFRQVIERGAGLVSPERLVKVELSDFDGHVYDLSSVGGWYVGHDTTDSVDGGIILSNCGGRCRCHLEYDVPSTVCGDALTFMESDGGPIEYVWMQEAESCRTPLNLSAFDGVAPRGPSVNDDVAFTWDADVAQRIVLGAPGLLVPEPMQWLLRAPKEGGPYLMPVGQGGAGLHLVQRFTLDDTSYAAVFQEVGDELRFVAGQVLEGNGALGPEFTIAALRWGADRARKADKALAFDPRLVNDGMASFLRELGAVPMGPPLPPVVSAMMPPSVAEAPMRGWSTPDVRSRNTGSAAADILPDLPLPQPVAERQFVSNAKGVVQAGWRPPGTAKWEVARAEKAWGGAYGWGDFSVAQVNLMAAKGQLLQDLGLDTSLLKRVGTLADDSPWAGQAVADGSVLLRRNPGLGGVGTTQDTMGDLIAHEYGHLLLDQSRTKLGAAKVDGIVADLFERNRGRLSTYADSTPEEFFGEAFALLTRPGYVPGSVAGDTEVWALLRDAGLWKPRARHIPRSRVDLPAFPDIDNLIDMETGRWAKGWSEMPIAGLEGTSVRRLLKDADGNQWLWKPGRVAEEKLGSVVRLFGFDAPPVTTVRIGDEWGTIQPLLVSRGASSLPDLTRLSREQVREATGHGWTDWLLANEDGHNWNYLLDRDGRVWAVDKSGALNTTERKTLREWAYTTTEYDSMAPVTGPEVIGGQLYDWEWRLDSGQTTPIIGLAAQTPDDVAQLLSRFDAVSDDAFSRALGDVPDDVRAELLRRKRDMRKDVGDLYYQMVEEHREQAWMPAVWDEWYQKSGRFEQVAAAAVNDVPMPKGLPSVEDMLNPKQSRVFHDFKPADVLKALEGADEAGWTAAETLFRNVATLWKKDVSVVPTDWQVWLIKGGTFKAAPAVPPQPKSLWSHYGEPTGGMGPVKATVTKQQPLWGPDGSLGFKTAWEPPAGVPHAPMFKDHKARDAYRTERDAIEGAPTETAVMFTPDGKVLRTSEGAATTTGEWSQEFQKSAKGSWSLHNHPDAVPPSPADIWSMERFDLAGIDVVRPGITYRLTPGPKGLPDREAVEKVYQDARDRLIDSPGFAPVKDEAEATLRRAGLYEETLKKLQADGRIRYEVIDRAPKTAAHVPKPLPETPFGGDTFVIPASAKDGPPLVAPEPIAVAGSDVPLDTPLVPWSGAVPDEPPLPAGVVLDADKKALREAADKAWLRWEDVQSGAVDHAILWNATDTAAATKAGLFSRKVGDTYYAGRTEQALDALEAAVKGGEAPGSDEFWLQRLGYSQSRLDAIDAYEAAKGGKRLGAGVVVEEPDGRLWFIAPRNRFAGYENTWSKGGVDVGETTAQAAVREIREEMGLSVELDDFLGDFANSDGTAITRYYIGHRTGGGPSYAKHKETYSIRLGTPEQVRPVMLRYGKPDPRDVSVVDVYLQKKGLPPVAGPAPTKDTILGFAPNDPPLSAIAGYDKGAVAAISSTYSPKASPGSTYQTWASSPPGMAPFKAGWADDTVAGIHEWQTMAIGSVASADDVKAILYGTLHGLASSTPPGYALMVSHAYADQLEAAFLKVGIAMPAPGNPVFIPASEVKNLARAIFEGPGPTSALVDPLAISKTFDAVPEGSDLMKWAGQSPLGDFSVVWQDNMDGSYTLISISLPAGPPLRQKSLLDGILMGLEDQYDDMLVSPEQAQMLVDDMMTKAGQGPLIVMPSGTGVVKTFTLPPQTSVSSLAGYDPVDAEAIAHLYAPVSAPGGFIEWQGHTPHGSFKAYLIDGPSGMEWSGLTVPTGPSAVTLIHGAAAGIAANVPSGMGLKVTLPDWQSAMLSDAFSAIGVGATPDGFLVPANKVRAFAQAITNPTLSSAAPPSVGFPDPGPLVAGLAPTDPLAPTAPTVATPTAFVANPAPVTTSTLSSTYGYDLTTVNAIDSFAAQQNSSTDLLYMTLGGVTQSMKVWHGKAVVRIYMPNGGWSVMPSQYGEFGLKVLKHAAKDAADSSRALHVGTDLASSAHMEDLLTGFGATNVGDHWVLPKDGAGALHQALEADLPPSAVLGRPLVPTGPLGSTATGPAHLQHVATQPTTITGAYGITSKPILVESYSASDGKVIKFAKQVGVAKQTFRVRDIGANLMLRFPLSESWVIDAAARPAYALEALRFALDEAIPAGKGLRVADVFEGTSLGGLLVGVGADTWQGSSGPVWGLSHGQAIALKGLIDTDTLPVGMSVAAPPPTGLASVVGYDPAMVKGVVLDDHWVAKSGQMEVSLQPPGGPHGQWKVFQPIKKAGSGYADPTGVEAGDMLLGTLYSMAEFVQPSQLVWIHGGYASKLPTDHADILKQLNAAELPGGALLLSGDQIAGLKASIDADTLTMGMPGAAASSPSAAAVPLDPADITAALGMPATKIVGPMVVGTAHLEDWSWMLPSGSFAKAEVVPNLVVVSASSPAAAMAAVTGNVGGSLPLLMLSPEVVAHLAAAGIDASDMKYMGTFANDPVTLGSKQVQGVLVVPSADLLVADIKAKYGVVTPPFIPPPTVAATLAQPGPPVNAALSGWHDPQVAEVLVLLDESTIKPAALAGGTNNTLKVAQYGPTGSGVAGAVQWRRLGNTLQVWDADTGEALAAHLRRMSQLMDATPKVDGLVFKSNSLPSGFHPWWTTVAGADPIGVKFTPSQVKDAVKALDAQLAASKMVAQAPAASWSVAIPGYSPSVTTSLAGSFPGNESTVIAPYLTGKNVTVKRVSMNGVTMDHRRLGNRLELWRIDGAGPSEASQYLMAHVHRAAGAMDASPKLDSLFVRQEVLNGLPASTIGELKKWGAVEGVNGLKLDRTVVLALRDAVNADALVKAAPIAPPAPVYGALGPMYGTVPPSTIVALAPDTEWNVVAPYLIGKNVKVKRASYGSDVVEWRRLGNSLQVWDIDIATDAPAVLLGHIKRMADEMDLSPKLDSLSFKMADKLPPAFQQVLIDMGAVVPDSSTIRLTRDQTLTIRNLLLADAQLVGGVPSSGSMLGGVAIPAPLPKPKPDPGTAVLNAYLPGNSMWSLGGVMAGTAPTYTQGSSVVVVVNAKSATLNILSGKQHYNGNAYEEWYLGWMGVDPDVTLGGALAVLPHLPDDGIVTMSSHSWAALPADLQAVMKKAGAWYKKGADWALPKPALEKLDAIWKGVTGPASVPVPKAAVAPKVMAPVHPVFAPDPLFQKYLSSPPNITGQSKQWQKASFSKGKHGAAWDGAFTTAWTEEVSITKAGWSAKGTSPELLSVSQQLALMHHAHQSSALSGMKVYQSAVQPEVGEFIGKVTGVPVAPLATWAGAQKGWALTKDQADLLSAAIVANRVPSGLVPAPAAVAPPPPVAAATQPPPVVAPPPPPPPPPKPAAPVVPKPDDSPYVVPAGQSLTVAQGAAGPVIPDAEKMSTKWGFDNEEVQSYLALGSSEAPLGSLTTPSPDMIFVPGVGYQVAPTNSAITEPQTAFVVSWVAPGGGKVDAVYAVSPSEKTIAFTALNVPAGLPPEQVKATLWASLTRMADIADSKDAKLYVTGDVLNRDLGMRDLLLQLGGVEHLVSPGHKSTPGGLGGAKFFDAYGAGIRLDQTSMVKALAASLKANTDNVALQGQVLAHVPPPPQMAALPAGVSAVEPHRILGIHPGNLHAAGTEVIRPDGLRAISSWAGGKVEAGWLKTGSIVEWATLAIDPAATQAQVRASVMRHLSSMLDNIASTPGMVLEVDGAVLDAIPDLRSLLLRYDARSARTNRRTWLRLNAQDATQLRLNIDAELGALSPAGTKANPVMPATLWPAPQDLTPVTKSVGGQTRKTFFKDADGNEWMFKPGATGRGAATDTAVSQLASLLGLRVPPVRQYILDYNGKPTLGSLYKLVPSAGHLPSMSAATPEQLDELMQHTVLDYLTGHDDAHVENFLLMGDGHLLGIDKTRSFLALGTRADSLDPTLNGMGGPSLPPAVNLFWRSVRQDPAVLKNISPRAIARTLGYADSITDEEYLRILAPVFAKWTPSEYPQFRSVEAFKEAVLKRKHNAKADLERHFATEVRAAMTRSPANVPDVWKQWLNDPVFKPALTPREVGQQRLADLNAKYGTYSKARLTQLVDPAGPAVPGRPSATALRGARDNIKRYSGSTGLSVAGASHQGYGAEHLATATAKDAYEYLSEVNQWAVLNAVNNPAITAAEANMPADVLNELRASYNPDLNKFLLIRGVSRESDPASYYAKRQKQGFRSGLGSAIGAANSHWSGLQMTVAVDPENIYTSTYTMPGLYQYGQGEREFIIRDLQLAHVVHMGKPGWNWTSKSGKRTTAEVYAFIWDWFTSGKPVTGT